MHLLWKDPPQTITQLTKTLGEKKGWNKNIIITYLKRLEEKGAVYYESGTKAKQYFPKITKEEAEEAKAEEAKAAREAKKAEQKKALEETKNSIKNLKNSFAK